MTHIAGPRTVDFGGQWIGPTQHHVLRAVRELGLETYDQVYMMCR